MEAPSPQDLAKMSERELFGALGDSLLGDGLGAGASDPGSRTRFAKDWFADRTTRFQDAYCRTRFAREAGEDGAADTTEVAALFLPIVNQNQITAMVVAAIVVRRGTRRFCRAVS